MVWIALQRSELAFVDLSAALTMDASDVRVRLLRAEVLLTLRQYDLAAFDSALVLKAMPWNSQALIDHAKAETGAGNEGGAIEDLTKLLGQRSIQFSTGIPQFREAALTRARLLLKVGRVADAHQALSQLLESSGKPTILRIQLYLRSNGYPNLEITGIRSPETDTALTACFADKVCGPQLKP